MKLLILMRRTSISQPTMKMPILPDSLKQSDSLQTFKYRLKRYFFNLYN